jgi:hypothetical protein
MLSPNDVKEELSLAFVHAVAARAHFAVEPIRRDRDSIDLKIMARGQLVKDAALESPELSVQLKSTARDVSGDDETIPFDLPAKNYQDLIKTCLVPRILIVFFMPENDQHWFQLSDAELVLRRCAYWLCLKGRPATQNENSQRVHLPRANVVTPEVLRKLLISVCREEDL